MSGTSNVHGVFRADFRPEDHSNHVPVVLSWRTKFRYSEIYSLPRVPGGGPIGSSGKYREELLGLSCEAANKNCEAGILLILRGC